MPIASVSKSPKGRALPSPPAFRRMVDSTTFSVLLFGVVVSLAPLCVTQLATDAKILNLPVYLLEQFRRRIPSIEVL